MLESARAIELEPLRLFLHVAATGSFSRAATLTSSTQSAVSKRIGALERQLDVRLFERTGRGARLTSAGRRLLPRAEALTAEIDRLPEFVADDGRNVAGVVRLSLQPSVSWPLVGDPIYGRAGSPPDFPRQALHAWRVAFTHPVTGERVECVAPPPDDIIELSATLGLELPRA